MRLTELDPRFLGAGGPGVSQKNPTTGEWEPAPARTGVGLSFLCPSGCGEELFVHFRNPLDGGPSYAGEKQPSWEREGDTFETLTLRPSIQRIAWPEQNPTSGACRWHGYITNGEIQTV